MSDRFWAKIWIGGPVPDHLMPDLRERLDREGLLGENWIIDDYIDDRSLLALEDSEASMGWFGDLEEWLKDNDIEYDRQSDGYADISPERAAFRRGLGERQMILDHDGYVVERVDGILDRIAQGSDLKELSAWLRGVSGQDLPRLKPFREPPVASVLSAAELKCRNTDGRAECAQCGGALSDPGMGPSFKHCPKCEP